MNPALFNADGSSRLEFFVSDRLHLRPPAYEEFARILKPVLTKALAAQPCDKLERMKYRQLADTGVFVSELCLGTMTFGGRGQIWETIGGLDQKAADEIVHRALDAGINFVDTADVYATGESETMTRPGARQPPFAA